MKIKICLMAMLWPLFGAVAQTHPPDYLPLAIGDTLPDIELPHLMNYPKSNVRLSDFKGKLLILDFWATWCSPCVAAFPKMDSLRKAFGDQLFILPVTDQDEKTVSSLLTNMQKVKGLQGFSVVRDTVLSQLFKHSEIPHYVWIDEKGIVSAITDGDMVTTINIEKTIQHTALNMTMKEDVRRIYDEEQPLLAGKNAIHTDSIVNYSVMTKYVTGYPSLFSAYPTSAKGWRVTGLNLNPFQLFSLAYSKFDPALLNNRKRCIIEVSDTSKLLTYYNGGPGKTAYMNWCKDNTYCYQLIVDQNRVSKVWDQMQEDLSKAFPQYQARLEKRNTKALVLVRSDKAASDQLVTQGGPREHTDNKYSFHLKNAPWRTLPIRLQSYYLQLANRSLIDETGITGNVDMDLSADLSNVTELRKALKRYGVDLIEAEREVEMLVIKDGTMATVRRSNP